MAAKLSSADSHAADDLCLVADTDLAKLDSGLENGGQVFYQLTEIDSSVSREIKEHLVVVKGVFRVDELHLQLVLANFFQADTEGFFFLLLVSLGSRVVIGVGDTDDRL